MGLRIRVIESLKNAISGKWGLNRNFNRKEKMLDAKWKEKREENKKWVNQS